MNFLKKVLVAFAWLTVVFAALFSYVSLAQATELQDKQAELTSVPKSAAGEYLKPRSLASIPEGEFGDKVRLGYKLFVDTQQLKDKQVGNELNCSNCHMNAGQQANASPLWAAYFAYPAYRKKNDKVNSYEERLQGCFTYSMNGIAPGKGSPELVALSAYSYWLGMSGLMDKYQVAGAVPELSDEELVKGGKRADFPVPEVIKQALTVEQRAKLPGKGFPSIDKPKLAYSPERGKVVYGAHCQTCHGDNGQGVEMKGVDSLPPLWGENSFNWGAGMHRVNTAAYFIYENMPFAKGFQLSNQEAWDVAAYINYHQRPQDPRFKGDVQGLKDKYHKHQGYYGEEVSGSVLGSEKSKEN
ncbi:cytochrome c [Shewanella psychrophila]|uniref:Cytochrome c n=1 Tax=Shewanella psychrophila TaxID=225848 RepID=A0A1S6HRH3_9GAMM|nr:c-type cytochrome [Shewanella psychrophila]AQS38098.1 cytochrome c [Shewanella psychrophila]